MRRRRFWHAKIIVPGWDSFPGKGQILAIIKGFRQRGTNKKSCMKQLLIS
jgi:hypothetical protein